MSHLTHILQLLAQFSCIHDGLESQWPYLAQLSQSLSLVCLFWHDDMTGEVVVVTANDKGF